MFLTADTGWISPITKIFGFIMNYIFVVLEKIGIKNGTIGIAIIVFTLITRLILYPMTINQQKSSKLMNIIQPEVNAVQQKYAGKTDQASVLAQQREIKEIYEKYGTSMTGSCLQLIIQMPIIFALYRVIMNIPAYVDSIKSHYMTIVNAIGGTNAVATIQKFMIDNNLTKIVYGSAKNFFDNPSSVTDTNKINNFIIDFLYKLNPTQFANLMSRFSGDAQVQKIANDSINYIRQANTFLYMDLSTAPSVAGFNLNPYLTIPIFAFLSQYISMQLMQKSTSKVKISEEENQMQQTMKSMNLMMPIMSAFFTWGFATGIGIYWIASAVFMTIQQIIVNKQMENIDLDELIKQNIKKANIKRQKKGQPLLNENQVISNIKKMEQKAEENEKEREKKLEGKEEKIQQADKYYFEDENKNSLFAKANMVSKYNEKNNK